MSHKLPEKSKLPPRDEPLDWHKRYFNVGNKITFLGRMDGKRKTGICTHIKKNRYGRISYFIGDDMALCEEIDDARK